MKAIFWRILLIVLVISVFEACKKEEGGNIVKKNGADHPDVKKFKTELNDQVQDLMSDEGLKSFGSMSKAFESFTGSKKSLRESEKINKLSNIIENNVVKKYPIINTPKFYLVKDKILNICKNSVWFIKDHSQNKSVNADYSLLEEFTMAKGVYRYNNTTGDYDRIGSCSSGIRLLFPTDSENHPNTYDGELFISELSGQEVTFDGETFELLSNFNIVLSINSTVVAGLSYEVVYGNDYIPVQSLILKLFVNPLEFNLHYVCTSTSVNLNLNLINNSNAYSYMSFNSNVTIQNNQSFSAQGNLQVLNLNAVYEAEVVPSNLDLNKAVKESNDISDFVECKVYSYPENNYIGRLRTKDITDEMGVTESKIVIETTRGDIDLQEFGDNLIEEQE